MFVILSMLLKSLLVAGSALIALRVAASRSAAERSTIAHLGLLGLLLVAITPLFAPPISVSLPEPSTEFGRALVSLGQAQRAPASEALPAIATSQVAPSFLPDWALMAYAIPALLMLLMTLAALVRLIALKARGEVVVAAGWINALARAQRRMGFKHGTALLVSDDLASPISWGLFRPVILLNRRAVDRSSDAEAIIAHELAHVARGDWIKLLLGRLVTSVFWLNPLAWLLSKEAHHLREEAADDAVLAAEIGGVRYAELLVGVARHDCRGLLIGAHGVAPGKGSLTRRVARVLDAKSIRHVPSRHFSFVAFVAAMLLAIPVAAITVAPATVNPIDSLAADASAALSGKQDRISVGGVPTDRQPAATTSPDFEPISRTSSAAPNNSVAPSQAGSSVATSRLSPREYQLLIQSASPQLAVIDMRNALTMRAAGVTPAYVRDLASAGFDTLGPREFVQARLVGLNGTYIRAMRAAGVDGGFRDYLELRGVGVTPLGARHDYDEGLSIAPRALVSRRSSMSTE